MTEEEFLDHIETTYFAGSLDTIESFSARKRVAANHVRIGILSVLNAAGEHTNAELREVTGLSESDFETHIEPLRNHNLIATTPLPAGMTAPETYHRITALGRSELCQE